MKPDMQVGLDHVDQEQVKPGAEPVIDVYWMDLDPDEAASARFAAMLSPKECRRAERFLFALYRRRYVARRGRLRELLGLRLDCDPRDVPITYNAFGKPRVEGSDVSFNLSHSRGMALFAVTRGLEIGCDIEWQDSRIATMDLAELLFSRREFESMRSLPERQRTEGFYNCWTRKEAFIKASGAGLSLPLDTFDVSLGPDEAAVFLRGGSGWSIEAFRPFEGFHAAIVVENRIGGARAPHDLPKTVRSLCRAKTPRGLSVGPESVFRSPTRRPLAQPPSDNPPRRAGMLRARHETNGSSRGMRCVPPRHAA